MNRFAILLAATALPLPTLAGMAPTALRCEYLTDPLGIGETMPRLSWIVESDRRGDRQTSYQLRVASRPDLLNQGQPDLWDSGRVATNQTAHVEYRGKRMGSGQRAYWTVTVWDRDGKPRTSRPASWEIGLLRNSDWRAKWISMPEPEGPKVDLAQAKWIWYPEGNPAETAPPGVRTFRTTIEVPAGAIKSAIVGFAADDNYEATLNGQAIANGGGWTSFGQADVKAALRPGRNELSVKATNGHSRAGLAVVGQIEMADGRRIDVTSSGDWEATNDGASWTKAMSLAAVGSAPFGTTRWSGAASPSPYLRRTFQVRGPVKRARAYVSALGIYKFFVDGKRVGDGVFNPGWTDYRKRVQYQTYDLTSMLRPGAHAVGMMLGDGWYCGHVGLTGRNNYGTKPHGLAQIEIEYTDGTKERVVTDGTWQVGTGPIRMSDLLMGEEYDARRELGNWATAGYRAKGWMDAETKELGEPALVGQHSPVVERIVELKPKAITQPKPGNFVFDLGQNMVGWARLRVRGRDGQRVQLRFAEMLNPDGTVYTTNLRGARATDTYTLKGRGQEVYEPSFTFHGFRYVEVTGYPGTPGPDAITGVVLSSATPQTGTFVCSNPMVNQLQSNIFWGQRGNYVDIPTDCPQRDERLGWMGDAQIFARTATFNNDIAAFITKWMQDVEDAQSPAGGFPDVAPRMGANGDGAPGWGDAGVIVPWTMYLAYGDRRMLARHYDAMAKWIEYVSSANPDHIWSKRGNANYGDWLNMGADAPREVLGTAYFAYSTDLMSRIARVLGKRADAAKYDTLVNNIKSAFNERFVSPDGRIKGDTQTIYVLALRFNLLPESLRPLVAKRLVDDIMVARKGHLSTGFLGVGYLNPTLTSIGATDVAYKLLQNETFPSWGYSIRQGATTIWERWDGWTKEKGFQDPGMNSFNHYSLGSVGEWMVDTVAGIDLDPSAPGYQRIVIRPRPGGGLTWARGAYDSIRGRIESSWRTTGDALSLDVTVPANTTATVYVPAASADGVTEGSGPASGAEGVKFERMENGAAVFTVGGGKYRFRSRLR
jgi:alpha-L-rhamnosidase